MKKKEFDVTNYIHIFLFVILFLLGFSYITTSNPDSDMWWMMSTGRWIISNKTVPTENVFVIHNGYHMIVQQWIPAVLNYIVYSRFGTWGLIWLATTMFGIICILLWKYISLFSKSFACKEIVYACSILFLLPFLTTRPTIFTIPILLLEMIQLEKWSRDKDWIHLCALPFLSIIEVNIHASLWPMMFVFILPYLIPGILYGFHQFFDDLRRNISLFFVLLISVITGCINPNGLEGVTYLLKSYGNGRVMSSIRELASPQFASIWGILLIGSVISFAIYIYRYRFAIDSKNIYLLGGTLILAFLHVRNLWTVMFGVVPVLCAILPQIKWDKYIVTIKKGCIYIVLGILLLICTFLKGITGATENVITMPIAEAEYMMTNTNPDAVILYTPFSYGGYMEWAGFKVYADARPELFQKSINRTENLDEEIYNVQYGIANYDEFVRKYGFTHFLVENHSTFDQYLKYSGNYVILEKSEKFSIYVTK